MSLTETGSRKSVNISCPFPFGGDEGCFAVREEMKFRLGKGGHT